jgi:hypothetical protein
MGYGSTVLGSSSGTFTSGDVGKGIIVLGAGANGGNLITTIGSYSSPSSVTLNAPAGAVVAAALYYYGAMTLEATIQSVQSTTAITLSVPANATISSATFSYGTDNHVAFQAAVDAAGQAGGGSVSVPAPSTCPAQATCGYVIKASDQMTAKAPGAVKIRYNNVSLIGNTPQTNLFCRGAWGTYTNSVAYPAQTATIRGFCVAIGDNGGPNGQAGTSVSNVTVANLHLYGMTDGNTFNNDYSFPPSAADADGWDTTHKALYMWDNSAGFSNITINSVVIQDFKGENIYSGGSAITGMIIENCTLKNFNGDGISMLAADLQVLNNTITNGSNAAVENSTESVGPTALIRQLYQGNTISYFPREGIVVVGVQPGVPPGTLQILNNYFDTIAQINPGDAEAAIYIATQSNGTAPSNVTISGNTCHDCNTLGLLGTGGTTQVTNNTFIVDRYRCNSFLQFMMPMASFTISNNTGYATANAQASGLTMGGVYMINPGYQSGSAVWNNVVIQSNAWTFPGTPEYEFVTSSGVGWNFVGLYNLIWKGDSCNGCTHADQDHGVVYLAQTRTIEPYGPVVYAVNNAVPLTATVDATKEQDGAQIQIVNAGSQAITFGSDTNMSLSGPVTLPGGANSSTTFVFNAGIGKFTLLTGSGSQSISATAGTPQSTTVNTAFTTGLQVTVTSGGSPVNGATVTFAAPASGPGAAFGGSTTATASTNSSGVATAPTLTANNVAGSYTVTASVAGAAASFNLTNMAGTPASISASNGTPQSTAINTAFGAALQATVKDAGGNLLSGATVTFSAPTSGSSAAFGGSTTVTATTNSSGVATAPTLTANSQTGGYGVTASVAGVAAPASFSLTNTAAPVAGSLQGSGTSATAAVSLTGEGTADWEHWGDANLSRKAGVTAQLSNYTVVGGGTVFTYNNDPRPLSWSDGNPTASSSNDTNGVYINGTGQGFSFTAPADLNPRTLLVHVGGWYSGGTLTAHLSDRSAADYTDVTTTEISQYDRNYTLTYHAGGAGQTLTVAWNMSSGLGNVTLNAAALQGGGGGGTILATAGTPQSTTMNTAFATALQVTVTGGGNPVNGATVTFTAPGSGSSAAFGGSTTATATTNSSGVAAAPTLTANNVAGPYTVTASVAGVGTSASFNLTNTAGTPASISASNGTPQSAGINTAFGTALQATVKDAGGNLLSGVTVTFTAPGSGSSVAFGGSTTATATTNSSGVATSPALTANNVAGPYTVTASVAGVGTSASFNLTNTAGTPASISASNGTPQSAAINTAFGTAPQATVKDAGGNLLSGVTVTFTAPGSGSSATFGGSTTATATTNSNGVATAPTLTANSQTGGYSVTASATGLGTSASFSLTNTAAAVAGSLQGSGTSATTVANLTAEGTADWEHWGDASLNRKAGVTAQLSNYSIVGSGTVFSYNNDPRPLSWTDGNPSASSSNNTNGVYINGTGQGFSFTAPADLTQRTLVVHVGGWFSGGTLTAHLSDQSAADYTDITTAGVGQYDRNYTLTYQAGGGGQTLTVTWKMTSGSGNVTLNAAALQGGGGGGTILATAGTPQSATINTAFATALQVTVTSGGNPVNGATVTFAAPASGSSAAFGGSTTATATTNSSGVATAPTLTANNVVGPYTVTASVASVGTSASFNLTNTAGTPASISSSNGTPQSAAINTAFGTALQATVKDAGGNLLSGVTVTFTAPGSGSSAAFGGSKTATASTNSSGVATAPALTANNVAGPYTVTASVAGVGTSASFGLTNTAGTPASISASNGTPQSAAINTAFGTALLATVKDAGGNLLSGVTVTFTAPGSGSSAAFGGSKTAIATTNSSGVATAPALTANNVAGPYTVTASVAGVGTSASFGLTNTAGAPASISASNGTPQSTTVSTAFATALQATVKDAGGNLLSGVTVTFTAPGSGSGAAFGGSTTATATTNSGGVATAPALTANNVAGPYTVTASVAGVGTPASFNLTNTAAASGSSGGAAADPPVAGATLAGAVVISTSPVNLTAVGTSDWIHWGDDHSTPASFNHKASGGSQISNYTVVGTTHAYTYTSDPRAMSWTDGSPTSSTSNDTRGIYNSLSAVGQGFSFTAPADTTTRTLVVYCGGQFDGGALTATLSDGSAPAFTYSASRANSYDLTITLTYQANSSGQTLTVTWLDSSLAGGSIWLAGAALQ